MPRPGRSACLGFDVMGEQALGVAAVVARPTGGLLGGGQYRMVQPRQLVESQAQLADVLVQLFEPIGFVHHRAGSGHVWPCWGCWALGDRRAGAVDRRVGQLGPVGAYGLNWGIGTV